MTLALGAAVVATFALVAVELLAGYAGHSIALVSDAVHNLTDVPTLVLSWLAMRWAAKPPTPQKTYGYHRAGILAAFVNAMLLALVSLGLIYESVLRLRTPVEVKTGLMLWVSVFALLINGGITLALSSGRRDLNLRSVWIHNLGDALSNVAIVVGALAIRYTGTTWADPVIGIAIGAMVLWSGVGILRESTHILLEGLPRSIALEEVARALAENRRRAGSSRHPYLDARHRPERALLPHLHSGHAHGRKRKGPRQNPRSPRPAIQDHPHHHPIRARRPPSRRRPLHARTHPPFRKLIQRQFVA